MAKELCILSRVPILPILFSNFQNLFLFATQFRLFSSIQEIDAFKTKHMWLAVH